MEYYHGDIKITKKLNPLFVPNQRNDPFVIYRSKSGFQRSSRVQEYANITNIKIQQKENINRSSL